MYRKTQFNICSWYKYHKWKRKPIRYKIWANNHRKDGFLFHYYLQNKGCLSIDLLMRFRIKIETQLPKTVISSCVKSKGAKQWTDLLMQVPSSKNLPFNNNLNNKLFKLLKLSKFLRLLRWFYLLKNVIIYF